MHAQPAKNPFRPGAGVPPPLMAGREREKRTFARVLAGAPELPANVLLVGLRGVGKTVLLREFEQVATGEGWQTSRVQVEPRHNTESALTRLVGELSTQVVERLSIAARLRRLAKDAIAEARGSISVTFDELALQLTPVMRGAEQDIALALFSAAKAADDHGSRGYLLMLDEAQVLRDERTREGEHPLSMLVAAVNGLQGQNIPVGLVVCGLPTVRSNLLRARTYSERMFRGEEIGRLDPSAGRDALTVPFTDAGMRLTDDLVERVAADVDGYPFFVQLWGAELWEAATTAGISELHLDVLLEIEAEIQRRLDVDFYAGRFESLTRAEQDLLMAASACPYPPLRSVDIRASSDKSGANVNVLMGRLIEQGVLFRRKNGEYEYTAPRFHEFLGRRAGRA